MNIYCILGRIHPVREAKPGVLKGFEEEALKQCV